MADEDQELLETSSSFSESEGKNHVEVHKRRRSGSAGSEQDSIQENPQCFLQTEKCSKWRNNVGFWILGLCNNFSYVVMLTAAYDLFCRLEHCAATGTNSTSTTYNESCTLTYNETTNTSSYPTRECLKHGTYQILLADILPALIIKLTAPYVMHHIPYWIRVLVVVLFSAASYITVALAGSVTLVLFGVVLASVSSGFGELTFLCLTTHYDRSTIGSWSSGTGAAGVGGALAYTGLSLILSPSQAILIQLVTSVAIEASYLFVLTKFKKNSTNHLNNEDVSNVQDQETKELLKNEDEGPLLGQIQTRRSDHSKKTLREWFCVKMETGILDHIKVIPRLLSRYMVWLFIVYFFEYSINQSLMESLYYANTRIGTLCISQGVQYKIYQVIYQVGVLIARSSVFIVRIRFFSVLSILQAINFTVLFLEVVYQFIPSFWITVVVVLYEGLLGGAVYVNAFYFISKQIPDKHREFSMGVASVADSSGITLAGLAAIGIHQFICSLG